MEIASTSNTVKDQRIDKPTRAEQLDAYCGYNEDLMSYARRKFGETPGGMNNRAIRAWYARNPDSLPTHLKDRRFGTGDNDLQVCHIIPLSHGGVNWPYNYLISTAHVNRYFGDDLSKQWTEYVGKDVFNTAKLVARWATTVSQVTFGRFDPVTDARLVRGT